MMRRQSADAHIVISAGLWASASVVELWMQWSLLSPPLSDYFGTLLIFAIVGVHALLGGLLGLLASWCVPYARVRLPLLVFVPMFLATAGVFASTEGLVSVQGLVAVLVACLGTLLLTKIRIFRGVATAAWFVVFVPVVIGFLTEDRQGSKTAIDRGRTDRPSTNVVLITIDTLRPDHLGLHGYSRRTSPYLDSLASHGVVFTEAYAPMPCTAPSHASIMTGQYPLNHGVLRNGWSLPRGIGTLAEAFRDAGYDTGAFVGVAHLAAAFGWGRGFDHYVDQGWYDQLFPYSGLHLVRTVMRLVSARFSRAASEVIDDVLMWLKNKSKGPFFMWIHLWDPHDPYAPPPTSFAPVFDDPADVSTETAYSPEIVARWIDGYDAEVHYVDRQLERVWRTLREQRLSERTVILVVSDHGESLGERSYRGHSIFLYEEQIRVLLLCVSPTLSHVAGSRVDQPVSLVDVAPTVLEIADIEWALGRGDGESLIRCLESSAPRRRPVLMESNMWGFAAKAVRQGGKKLVIHRRINPTHRGFAPRANPEGFTSPLELFDLVADPGERTNLAAAHPETVTMLRTLIESMLPATADSSADFAVTPGTVDALRELGYLD